jgi:NAD-dependent SIR2 family protein deacetylase
MELQPDKGDVLLAADALRRAEALLITAGAGLGVDSGFPDFRGSSGFWNAYPPYARLGIHFQQLACPDTLRGNPTLFWGFYEHRRVLYHNTDPHQGYSILRNFSQGRPTFVFTSNVDGHFQRAGFPPEQILECHGNIHSLQCSTACDGRIWPVGESAMTVDPATMLAGGELPRCPRCGEFARPNVLMFGDATWISDRADSQQTRYTHWLAGVRGKRLAVLELGAGTAIPTVRFEGELVAKRYDGTLIRINPRESQIPNRQGISLPGNALATLQLLAEAIESPSRG